MAQNTMTANAVAGNKKELSPLDIAVRTLSSDAMKKQFATACPTHLKVNAERYVRQFCTQLRLNPKLLQCDQASLIGAMMTGTALGLDPSPSLGEFYIIPYENAKRRMCEAQFQLGYKGMVALAYRGGVKRFQAHAIHEKDEFEYSLGLAPMLKHRPYLGGDRGKAVAYYAVAELPSGEMVFEIMSRADVEGHAKKYSKSHEYGPWKTEFDEMAKKTVAKSLFKWIPKSTEIAIAVVKDGSVAHINEEIRSQEEVLEADVNYLDTDEPELNGALESEILASATAPKQALPPKVQQTVPNDFPLDNGPEPKQDLAPVNPDMITFEDVPVTQHGNSKPTSNGNGYATESEKLRTELMEGLRLGLTEQESEDWCIRHFDKEFKKLTRDELKTAISKLNAEMEARAREM